MRAARFVALECVHAHQLGEFEEIGNSSSALQGLVKIFVASRDAYVAPELLSQFGDFLERLTQSFFVARHPAFGPEKETKLAMERIDRTAAIDLKEFLDPGTNIRLRSSEFGRIRRWPFSHLRGEIIRQRVRQNKITVCQTLHESAGSEPVRAVIGKIRFADYKEPGHIAHQVVINPETAHRVVNGGVNSHRHFIGVFAGDLFVNFKQISIPFADGVFPEALNRIGKIEINAAPAGANTAAFVANFLRRARGNIARSKIAVTRIFSLEIIIAICLRDFAGHLVAIFLAFRNPHASVVPQRLGHERELGLMFATNRDAGGMNLRKGWIGKKRAPFVSAVRGRNIAAARISREIKYVSVSAGGEDNGLGCVGVDLSGAQAAGDNSLGVSIDNYQIEHLRLREHSHRVGSDLAAQRLITAKQKLLTSLSTRVKCP